MQWHFICLNNRVSIPQSSHHEIEVYFYIYHLLYSYAGSGHSSD